MAILRARDKKGNLIDIPAIKGDPGKSAYEYAKEGGYTGTEEEFIELLANLPTGGSSCGDDCESVSNKVQEITEDSTEDQYPSAKAVYDSLDPIDKALKQKITAVNGKTCPTDGSGAIELTFNDIKPIAVQDLAAWRDTEQSYVLPDGYVYTFNRGTLSGYEDLTDLVQCDDANYTYTIEWKPLDSKLPYSFCIASALLRPDEEGTAASVSITTTSNSIIHSQKFMETDLSDTNVDGAVELDGFVYLNLSDDLYKQHREYFDIKKITVTLYSNAELYRSLTSLATPFSVMYYENRGFDATDLRFFPETPLEAQQIVVNDEGTTLDTKLDEIESKIDSSSQSSDLILTDTETGTKYKLTITSGKLTLVEQPEDVEE